MPTWDGGGAHANSRWNEELVRTERERERERVLFIREGNRARVTKAERERECFIQGQFGTGRERERVWHVIFIWKNRSHWEVLVFEGKPSTSWPGFQ